jgi:hypothetical protein
VPLIRVAEQGFASATSTNFANELPRSQSGCNIFWREPGRP